MASFAVKVCALSFLLAAASARNIASNSYEAEAALSDNTYFHYLMRVKQNILRNIADGERVLGAIDALQRSAVVAREIDEIGGGNILGRKRSMDEIGGGNLLGKRSMDEIGGGNLLGKRSMDEIGGGNLLGKRSMDEIGGGHLIG